RTAVPEGQLERREVEREAQQLVAETDAEERHAPEQIAHRLDRPAEHRRVARAVADEHCARLELEDRVRVPVAGDDRYLEARLGLDAAGLGPARVDAVIADERIGEAEHLGDVARVGRGLLVARARGREAGLAGGHAGSADRPAGKDRAVLEHEMRRSLHCLHLMRSLYYYA